MLILPPIPDQVYINGEKKEFQSYFEFPGTNNNITLIWNNCIDQSHWSLIIALISLKLIYQILIHQNSLT